MTCLSIFLQFCLSQALPRHNGGFKMSVIVTHAFPFQVLNRMGWSGSWENFSSRALFCIVLPITCLSQKMAEMFTSKASSLGYKAFPPSICILNAAATELTGAVLFSSKTARGAVWYSLRQRIWEAAGCRRHIVWVGKDLKDVLNQIK